MTATATIAERARENAIHCEAKKHAYRQTQDGVVVSFVLHPQDIPEGLATASLGTRYMLALVEIGDDETPKEAMPAEQQQYRHIDTSPRPASAQSGGAIKERRRFDDLPIATQAVLWCQEPAFWKFLQEKYPTAWSQFGTEGSRYEDAAAGTIRHICKVNSRGSIKADNPFWRNFVAGYQAWKLV